MHGCGKCAPFCDSNVVLNGYFVVTVKSSLGIANALVGPQSGLRGTRASIRSAGTMAHPPINIFPLLNILPVENILQRSYKQMEIPQSFPFSPRPDGILPFARNQNDLNAMFYRRNSRTIDQSTHVIAALQQFVILEA